MVSASPGSFLAVALMTVTHCLVRRTLQLLAGLSGACVTSSQPAAEVTSASVDSSLSLSHAAPGPVGGDFLCSQARTTPSMCGINYPRGQPPRIGDMARVSLSQPPIFKWEILGDVWPTPQWNHMSYCSGKSPLRHALCTRLSFPLSHFLAPYSCFLGSLLK